MIKCLLTELGRAGLENIWPSVMMLGPYAMTTGPIFFRPAVPLSTDSVSARANAYGPHTGIF